jgi:hypothetical protein
MNVNRSLWMALPLALLLPIGCNNGTTGQTAESATDAPGAAAQAASPAEHGRRHGHHAHGPVGMLFHAARELDLSAAQRATVDQLQQQLHGDHPARAEHQAVHAALVEGVRAGAIDLGKIAPLQTAATQARQAHAQREAAALNGLWAALQPAQRQAVVAAVREREGRHAGHGQRAGSGWQDHRAAHLGAELGLDATQQQSVESILASNRPSPAAMEARHAAMKQRTEALLTAFAGDAFDAGKLDLSPPADAMGPGHLRPEVLAQIVPLLRADQREKLAASMEKTRG